MKHDLYTVFDEKAQCFTAPFNFNNTSMAKRAFGNSINDPKHNFGMNPSDYTLFKIAEYDDNTAELVTMKVSLGNGIEFLKPELGPEPVREGVHRTLNTDNLPLNFDPSD